MRWCFEDGVAVGQQIERLRQVERRVSTVEQHVGELREEVATLRTWLRRAALLAAIWAGAIGVNIETERLAVLLTAVSKLR